VSDGSLDFDMQHKKKKGKLVKKAGKQINKPSKDVFDLDPEEKDHTDQPAKKKYNSSDESDIG
jgi:hypothetical protein